MKGYDYGIQHFRLMKFKEQQLLSVVQQFSSMIAKLHHPSLFVCDMMFLKRCFQFSMLLIRLHAFNLNRYLGESQNEREEIERGRKESRQRSCCENSCFGRQVISE